MSGWPRSALLSLSDKTGAAELSMDATNPRILYAAMWEHGRLPWKVISGGPGSGQCVLVHGQGQILPDDANVVAVDLLELLEGRTDPRAERSLEV